MQHSKYPLGVAVALSLVFTLPTPALAADAKPELVCRTERDIGSNMMVRTCKTREQIEAESIAAREANRLVLRSSAPVPKWVYLSGTATVASGVLAGMFASLARMSRNEAEQVAKQDGLSANRQIREKRSTFENRRTLAWVLGGATLAFATITTVGALMDHGSPLAVAPTQGGAVAAVDVLALGEALGVGR